MGSRGSCCARALYRAANRAGSPAPERGIRTGGQVRCRTGVWLNQVGELKRCASETEDKQNLFVGIVIMLSWNTNFTHANLAHSMVTVFIEGNQQYYNDLT